MFLVSGCKSLNPLPDKAKTSCTLRLHQEVVPDPTGRSENVTVHKDPLITLNIDRNPFLTEGNVKQVKVIDIVGGIALSVQFDRQGSWLLEQYTSATRGRHIAIFSQWHDEKSKELNAGHWLAAIKVTNHITDGLLIFTPDATKEEATSIAKGLNEVAKDVHMLEEQIK